MADETELELDQNIEPINKTQERITSLSNKVRETSKERDDAKEAAAKADSERQAALKERDFYQGFAGISAKYPAANEHMEDIKAKVLAGYSPEDAAVAVLAQNGKFGISQAPVVSMSAPGPAAGGSASVTIPEGGTKSAGQMSQAERL